MNCFYHPTIVAVGTCKSCGKGLCPTCATDLGKGLACRGKCEENVRAAIRMIDYSIAMVDNRKGNMRGGIMTNAGLHLASGMLFIIAGVALTIDSTVPVWISLWPIGFGAIFMIAGYLTLRRGRNLPQQVKNSPSSP